MSMNITIRGTKKYPLIASTEQVVRDKLSAPLRLLGKKAENSLLEIEVEEAPAEGRSSTPVRLEARLTVEGKTFYADAVKPTPEIAADRVRSELTSEIRKYKGKAERLRRDARRNK